MVVPARDLLPALPLLEHPPVAGGVLSHDVLHVRVALVGVVSVDVGPRDDEGGVVVGVQGVGVVRTQIAVALKVVLQISTTTRHHQACMDILTAI